MSAPTYFPSAWRIGAARAIAALPSPVSQYASPTNASLVRRPFNRSCENCTPLIRPPLDATNRPRPSTTSSPSQSGQRSRTELRYSRSRPTASQLVPWILARFSATAYAVAATRRSRSRSPSHSSISHAAWVLVPRRSWAIWSPIDLWLFRDDTTVKASGGTSVATTANTSIWFLMLSRWNSRSQRAMVSCQTVTVGRPPGVQQDSLSATPRKCEPAHRLETGPARAQPCGDRILARGQDCFERAQPLRPELLHPRRRLPVRQLRVLDLHLTLGSAPSGEAHLHRGHVRPGDPHGLVARRRADGQIHRGQPPRPRAGIRPRSVQPGNRCRERFTLGGLEPAVTALADGAQALD